MMRLLNGGTWSVEALQLQGTSAEWHEWAKDFTSLTFKEVHTEKAKQTVAHYVLVKGAKFIFYEVEKQ